MLKSLLFAATMVAGPLVNIQTATAQVHQTDHILTLEAGAERPQASIEEVAWLAGHWAGDGLGGRVEETWNAPSGGTMLGSFKLIHDGEPSMYELELLAESEGSLVWQVKHFDSAFHAWEEKEEYVAFPLVKVDDDAVYFDGLTVRRDGENQLTIFVALGQDGGVREEQIVLERVR